MNNLTSEKPIDFRKLIDVAYLVLVLAAFAWAKEFLLALIPAILISFLTNNQRLKDLSTPNRPSPRSDHGSFGNSESPVVIDDGRR